MNLSKEKFQSSSGPAQEPIYSKSYLFASQTPASMLFSVHFQFLALCSTGSCKEHKANRVGTVQSVNKKVEDGHDGDHHPLVRSGTDGGVRLNGFGIAAKHVHWPDHHSRQIHQCCQNVVDDH